MSKANKKFDLDLAFGNQFESIIENILSGKSKIEVKAEKWGLWNKTGNIAVEIKYKNEKSGIEASESDYWVHCLTKDKKLMGAFIFSIDLLKQYLKKLKEQNKLRTLYAGDGRRSLIVLIPIKNLHEIMLPTELVLEV